MTSPPPSASRRVRPHPGPRRCRWDALSLGTDGLACNMCVLGTAPDRLRWRSAMPEIEVLLDGALVQRAGLDGGDRQRAAPAQPVEHSAPGASPATAGPRSRCTSSGGGSGARSAGPAGHRPHTHTGSAHGPRGRYTSAALARARRRDPTAHFGRSRRSRTRPRSDSWCSPNHAQRSVPTEILTGTISHRTVHAGAVHG